VEGGARGLRRQGVACEGVTVFSNETQEKQLEKMIRDLEQLMGMKEVEIALLKRLNLRFA